ncbi:MAG: dephospho-CoA kinase [Acidobacteria bacterium]|nr:dephospho-CoA kinase [Acidobacteriota bacterium]
MLRVGLTGGFATGKSHVGRALAELGCYLVKADELGHQALEPGGAAWEPVVREFGRGILDEGERIDRRKLGEEVFARPERLALLNGIMHPVVIRREEQLIAEAAAADPNRIAVVEAAILVETGSWRRFDRLIVTVCPLEAQLERAMKRDGLSREQALARIARQMPLEEKRKYAHYVIDTSGTREDTCNQTVEVYRSLRSIQQV